MHVDGYSFLLNAMFIMCAQRGEIAAIIVESSFQQCNKRNVCKL